MKITRQSIKLFTKKALMISFGGLFFLWVLNLIFPLRVDIKYAPIVISEEGEVLHAFLSDDDKWRMMIEPHEISEELKKAFIHKEDRFFYWHFGCNPVAIFRAAINNLASGKRTSGASTITMQVARLLEPKPRTYGNKLVEVFRALQLEWRYSKDEILQLYLNLVPYGGNVEGVKAAALLYFDKAPNHLSLAEVTALAVIPNRPNSLHLGRANEQIMTARNHWLNVFKQKEVFGSEIIQDALTEPLTAQRREAPREAPHISWRLKHRFAQQPIIRSTLKWSLQQKIEQLTHNHINLWSKKGVQNAAVMVVDNSSGSVLSYVGSSDFYNSKDAGQVDGVRAIRSPGSTLKPLLYALAMEQGLVTPQSKLLDVPVNYSGYEPENFDEKFHGSVSVQFALANSLNVPAVKLLDQLGTQQFVGKLSDAGFNQIKQDARRLGLSTVLGGCGVRLEELTALYRAFANGGVYSASKFSHDQDTTKKVRILSAGTTYMLTDILTSVTRPDLPLQWHNAANLPKVAWKTGTSYGRRDAWSVGYNRHYTVAVWVGNFSGKGVPELTGADAAAPLFFQVFNAVDYSTPKDWYAPPDEVRKRFVCNISGQVPNHYCEDQIMDDFIEDVSSNRTCNHMQYIWLDKSERISYCTSCLPVNGYKKVLYPNHSGALITYFQQHNIPYQSVPAHNPACERIWVDGAPQIVSPLHGVEYFVNQEDSMQMKLLAQVDNDVQTVYWFIDDRFYKKAAHNEALFFNPKVGNVKISCSDDKGRNSDVLIKVKAVGF